MFAVMASGLVVAVAQTLLETYAPELPATEILTQLDVWVQMGVMVLFGYITRERA
jgi:hypothetical protein